MTNELATTKQVEFITGLLKSSSKSSNFMKQEFEAAQEKSDKGFGSYELNRVKRAIDESAVNRHFASSVDLGLLGNLSKKHASIAIGMLKNGTPIWDNEELCSILGLSDLLQSLLVLLEKQEFSNQADLVEQLIAATAEPRIEIAIDTAVTDCPDDITCRAAEILMGTGKS